MDKQQFKDFCKQYFISYGFVKKKSHYFLAGHEVLCEIDLQKSNYGPAYYVNFTYYIGDFSCEKNYPAMPDYDVSGRILVMSKTSTIKGKHFLTSFIEYEQYSEDELRTWFDEAFEEWVMPPILLGKKCILDGLNTKYYIGLHQEKTMEKLKE